MRPHWMAALAAAGFALGLFVTPISEPAVGLQLAPGTMRPVRSPIPIVARRGTGLVANPTVTPQRQESGLFHPQQSPHFLPNSLASVGAAGSAFLAAALGLTAVVRRHRKSPNTAWVPLSADSPQIALLATTGRRPPVVIAPSYNLAAGTAGVSALLAALPGSGLADFPAVVFGLLAALFGVQTGRVKFCFDDQAMEIRIGDDLKKGGENIVVGGANRWNYKSFVNWDIFPNRSFPILVYFKENQTPKEKWGEGPGGLDKIGGGQVHFFPAVCNVEQICEQFETRGCKQVRK